LNIDDIDISLIINLYKELNSSYKVAKSLGVSATAVKRVLKQNGVLRSQSEAAKSRNNAHLNYTRTEKHKKTLSDLGKLRTKDKNPFFGKKHTVEARAKIGEQSKTRTLKRNPNYKHGLYVRRPRDFKLSEFSFLRKQCFERDEFCCYYCNKIGGFLHAHHILPYWFCPEAFLDINNLKTVCKDCHFLLAHKNSWHKFDTSLITENLVQKYKIDRERLNDLTSK
jgi:hypothetical protein